MKKKVILFTLTFILLITSTVIGAILTSTDDIDDDFTVGFIKVDINAYFEKGSEIYDHDDNIEAFLYQDGLTPLVKKGVFLINITEEEHRQFIENFRVNFLVKSNVETYFRIKFMQSKVLKTTNAQGLVTEYVLIGDFAFNINENFHYVNGYYYFKDKVKAIDETTPLNITFIGSYFSGQSFSPAPLGQELQASFKVEAVQAIGGPQTNWNLQTPPWGGTW